MALRTIALPCASTMAVPSMASSVSRISHGSQKKGNDNKVLRVACSMEEKRMSPKDSFKVAMAASLAALTIGSCSEASAQIQSVATISGIPEAIQEKIEEVKGKTSDYANVGKDLNNSVASKVGYGKSKGETDDQVEALENAPEGTFNLGARPSQSGSTNFGQTGDLDAKFGEYNVGK